MHIRKYSDGDARRLDQYDELLCASNWNADLLPTISDKPLAMIHEGVDQSLFFPGPRSGIFDQGRFYVFSGGKIEFRKAQDLVIFAFRGFAKKHDDAVLVTAWNLRCDDKGALEITRWAVENRITRHQLIELTMTANPLMPMVLRQMDCAIQVSRCEPCINLPAMEAMACGVPVILSSNTGTHNLAGVDNCIALRSQDPLRSKPGVGTDGWGETRVEEIVAALENPYTDTRLRRKIASRSA